MKQVLVLCTGNSCRSIMAEAMLNHFGKGQYHAVSAGSSPAGYVHPESIAALQRHGIEAVAPRSKSWDEFAGQPFELVITVCDQAASESCPVLLGAAKQLHWSIPDPAKAEGSEDTVRQAFEHAFELLEARMRKQLL